MKKNVPLPVLIILLVLNLVLIIIAPASVGAQSYVKTSISLTILSFGTNSVAVGTIANVGLAINPAPPNEHDYFTNFAFTAIQPDGTEKNIAVNFSPGGNRTGGLYTDLTSAVGTWTLKARFLGKTFENGVTYLPSETQTTYTVIPNPNTMPQTPYTPPLEITINADESINPSNVSIQQNGNIYSLTNNITGRITVNKDNIVLKGNGYSLVYGGSSPGNVYTLSLSEASNVTVTDLTIVGGWFGIIVGGKFNVIANNTITQTGNNFYSLSSPSAGIGISGNSNVVTGNNLTNNDIGIDFFAGQNNVITRNQIEGNSKGVMIWGVSNNTIYHNNFINNDVQAETATIDSAEPVNVWDDGYPFGGNYWSDYCDRYPNATEIDNTGIVNTPYVLKTWYHQLDLKNVDRYPLMQPFTTGTYLLQNTPPEIHVSPLSVKTNTESNISITFTGNKPLNWTGYSLDGQQNVTITGNTTLTGLSAGSHSIVVYANDTYGNMGISETQTFTIQEPFPTATVVAVGIALAVVIGAGLLVYFRMRRH